MAPRKKEPSFDAMIKYFIEKYKFATKQDINRIERKLNDLEKTIKKLSGTKTTAKGRKNKSAAEIVLDVIKDNGNGGASISDIKTQTDYDDKKLRNIVFRLNKEGKIKRKKRGVYVGG